MQTKLRNFKIKISQGRYGNQTHYIMRYLGLVLIVFLSLVACNSDSKIAKQIAALEVDAQVIRFDREFAQTTPAQLGALKAKYPIMFSDQYSDDIWLSTLTDTLQIALNNEVALAFPDFQQQELDLESLYRHFKYYFPEFEPPLTYTAVTFVDYRNRVLAKGDNVIIAIDTYLGSDHPFYVDIPVYITQNLRQEQMVQDVAALLAKRFVAPPQDRSFLGQMIYYGKMLYLKDLLLPNSPEHERIGYSEQHFDWSLENEQDIWRYFVEKEVLYSTSSKLLTQFIQPAPFSKFYLEIDNESPGRIGRFIGWQMVRQYMEKNTVSISEMLTTSAETIYKQSNYKPKK